MALPIIAAAAAQAAGGILGARSARKAAEERARAIKKAYGEFRSPEDIIAEQYTTGLYGDETMSAILGKETELIPQFQELAGLSPRGS